MAVVPSCSISCASQIHDILAAWCYRPTSVGRPLSAPSANRLRSNLSTAALRAALEAQFAKTTLGEVYARRGIGLSISAVEMTQHRSWVFKTPHLSTTNHRDDGTTLVDVCMASLDEIRQDLRVTPGSCLGRRLASRFQRAQRADCCPWGTSQGPPYKSIRRNACGQAEARHQD